MHTVEKYLILHQLFFNIQFPAFLAVKVITKAIRKDLFFLRTHLAALYFIKFFMLQEVIGERTSFKWSPIIIEITIS